MSRARALSALHLVGTTLAAAALLAWFPFPAAGQEEEPAPPPTLLQALKEGKVVLGLLYRFEAVSDDAPAVAAKDAHASTLRTVLGYRTGSWHGLSAYLEGENVAVLGDDAYNNAGAGSLANGVRDRPVVADPAGTEVQQAFLRWEGAGTSVDLGRRELLLGSLRFIGNVGWRQNHQAYDGLTVVNRSLPRTTLTYAFIDNTNRIFGDNKPMASHLLDARHQLAGGELGLFAYLLDYDEAADSSLSTATYGAAFTGSREVGRGLKLLYDAEAAWQRDHGDNPGEVDAGYLRGEVGIGAGAFTAKVAYELLEGGPEDGKFTTPLATLHKWNGWADRFLATPATGLEDRWLSLGYKQGAWNAAVIYHRFESDTGGLSYGDELDLVASFKSHWGQTFGAKAAFYEAEDFSFDVTKVWLWTEWSF